VTRYLVRSLGRAVLVVVLVASGWYTALSLYWWEWQRAFFYGLTFVAALVVVLFLVLQARLDRLERQLVGRTDTSAGDPDGGHEEIPANPERGFAWLNPGQGTFVFVPLLVGFGVAVSALAVAVERVAGFVLTPAADSAQTLRGEGQRPGRRRLITTAVGFVLVAALVVALIVPLIGAAVYAPEAPEPGRRVLDVQVRGVRVETNPVAAVTSLAGYCRTQTRAPIEIDAVRSTGSDTVQLTLHPRLHPDDQRRFEGCLDDRMLDRHTVRVLDVRDVADEAG
jgi:hypothetical protein